MTTSSFIHQAASLLRQNQLVAFPTETVYGLGGNALSDDAVAAIYAAKGRPSHNPLIVHVGSLEEAERYGEFSAWAQALARHFWPGPLTLVLPRQAGCALSPLVSAGGATVAIRVPAHPLAQALLRACGLPIAAPSANRSGRVSPTEAAHVEDELGGRVAMIVDGGPCRVGIESTVVDATGEVPVVLRPGAISMMQINEAISSNPRPLREGEGGGVVPPGGLLIKEASLSTRPPHPRRGAPNPPLQGGRELLSPGLLASHYAPSRPVRLNAATVAADEALLAFGPRVIPGAKYTQNLSPTGNLEDAAANLFHMLRLLDRPDVRAIAVMSIPQDEDAQALGIAINDRLSRAAAPANAS